MQDKNGDPMRSFLSTDGEAIILSQAFDADVLAAMAAARIDYLKGSPSGTSAHQPADVSSNFRAVKAGMAHINGVNFRKNTRNGTLRDCLSDVFVELDKEFPKLSVTRYHQEMVKVGMEKLLYVLMGKWFQGDEIIEGFVQCGQHVPDAEGGAVTVDYDKIMSKCLTTHTEQDLLHMKTVKNLAIQECYRTGRLTNPFLDELEVVKDPDAVDRDELTMCRQDCFLVTHVDSIARHKEIEEKKKAAKDVDAKKMAKERADAEKLLRRDVRAEAKVARNNEEKAKKEEDKARKKSLTKEQKQQLKAEADLRKAAAAEAKRLQAAEAAAEHADRVAQAKELLGNAAVEKIVQEELAT